jgi:hypothetical protein
MSLRRYNQHACPIALMQVVKDGDVMHFRFAN